MAILLKRDSSGDTTIYGKAPITINVPRDESAVGALSSLKCSLKDGDRIYRDRIIGKDGVEKPRMVKFPDNSREPEIIDAHVLYDVRLAESLRWEIVGHMRDNIIPEWEVARDAMFEVGIGHYRTKENKYMTYYVKKLKEDCSYISFRHIKHRPKRMLNAKKCERYANAENALFKWNCRLYNYNEIFHKALTKQMPEKYWRDINSPYQRLVIFEVNGREYIYLWGSSLFKFSYPGPYKDKEEIIERVNL